MASGSENDRKVFVGGLSNVSTTESLKHFFSQYGAVTDAHVMEYFDKRLGTKRTRGFGFVVFESAESVEQVVTQHKMLLDDKEVEVKRIDDNKSSLEGKQELEARKIFCGGLAETVTNESLREFFLTVDPNLEEAKVMHDPHTQRSRCFGYVTFSSKDFVDKAVANSSSNYIDGKWVDVKASMSNKGKGKGKDGKGKDGGKGKGKGGWDAYGGGYDAYGKGAAQSVSGYAYQPQYAYAQAAYYAPAQAGYVAAPQYGYAAPAYGQEQAYPYAQPAATATAPAQGQQGYAYQQRAAPY